MFTFACLLAFCFSLFSDQRLLGVSMLVLQGWSDSGLGIPGENPNLTPPLLDHNVSDFGWNIGDTRPEKRKNTSLYLYVTVSGKYIWPSETTSCAWCDLAVNNTV